MSCHLVPPAVRSAQPRLRRLVSLVLPAVLCLCAHTAHGRLPDREVGPDLRDQVRAARARAFGATAPDGVISAASHQCVPLVIACNDAGVGTITTHDCVTDGGTYFDIVFFSAVAGQTITADLASPDFDPFLFLFDPDVNVVADDDDSGPGLASRIVYLIDQTSDSWSFAVVPLFGGLGDYLLSLACTAAPVNTPAAPSNLQAQAQSSSQVFLTWNDNSNNETSFRVEMRSGGGFQEIGSVSANSTSATVTALQPGSTVDFRVRARNNSGNSPYSNVATVTLPTTGGGGTCVPGPSTLCLTGGRFRAQVDFNTAQGGGSSGTANAIPLADVGVDRGGMFTFFNAANPEMLLKVLNGCPVNGHFWVFYAATTNVGFQVRVTDTQTGTTWTRSNTDGNPAPPVQDTNAFATCP